MIDKQITAQDIKQFKAEIIAWWNLRPIYSCLDGRIIGYVKLTIG